MRILAAFLLAGLALLAQSDLSTIRGVVTDQSGAVVPNLNITLTNLDRNTTRTTSTTTEGTYEIPFLVPGLYKLTAVGAGFKEYVADQIRITSRETRRIDVGMEVGQVGTSVSVSAEVAAIETEGAQVADGFNNKKFVDSPLSSSSFFPQAFMTTLPNVQTNMGGWGLRFAGQGSNSNNIAESMDGVISDGPVNLVQNMFDFEELQVVAVNNSAEFSRVANFTMTGRGGTNQFHGRIWYDVTNSALNARNTFAPYKVPYKDHRGAGSVSGPIIKNKTFFYGSYNIVRIPSSTFYNRNVPTSAMRNGDFSAIATAAAPVRDPLTMVNGVPSTGTPFPGNVIPTNRINAMSKLIQDTYIPAPNQLAPGARTNNYGFLHPWPTDLFKWDSLTGRIDHNFSEKNTLFARYINRLTPYVLAGSFPQVGTWTRARNHHSIVASDTHVFSPGLVNTFRWGWIKDYFFDGDTIDGYTPIKGDAVVKSLGLQGVNPQGFSAMGFPTITVTGIQQLRVQPGGVAQDINIHSFANTTSYSFGGHVLKFGAEVRTWRDYNDVIPENTYGNFSFDGSLSGQPYADFLLGLPSTSSRIDPLRDRTRRAAEIGLYINDTWKVNRKLTLDYGLRWDYFKSPYYTDNLMFNWDPVSGAVIVPQESLGKISPLYPTNTITVKPGQVVPDPYKKNFRPRTGIAYRITDTFVIRGGYGQYSESLGALTMMNTGAGPYRIADTFVNLDQLRAGRAPFSFPNPFPAAGGALVASSQSVTGFPNQTRNGVIHQFNATLEKEIHKLGFRLSYIGSRSNGLNYTLSTNKPAPSLTPFTAARRPYPQFIGTTFWQNDGKAKYDSAQIEVTKRYGWAQFNGHYTLSNSMANYLNLENPYKHDYWNRDQYNARNRAVITTNWDLPFGKGKKFLSAMPKGLNYALGGWQAQTVHYFQGGQYFTPSYSSLDPSNTNTFGGIPDRIADGNLDRGTRSIQRWFDPSAFTTPQPGRFGNSGVNILQGPGLNLHHLALTKDFPITERWKVILQGSINNIFNHPHYNYPNANISVPGQVGQLFQTQEGGGQAREVSDARHVFLRLRIEF
ncbi:MAG: TonB-dependent receptor [Bryobacterales bacterium]|nr:TonB-dependent receptor [Bryobacterales bacterium]